MISYSDVNKDDDRWLYLPALKKSGASLVKARMNISWVRILLMMIWWAKR
jgi:hypothetical protein